MFHARVVHARVIHTRVIRACPPRFLGIHGVGDADAAGDRHRAEAGDARGDRSARAQQSYGISQRCGIPQARFHRFAHVCLIVRLV